MPYTHGFWSISPHKCPGGTPVEPMFRMAQMPDYSWMWLDEDLSDVRLRFVYATSKAGSEAQDIHATQTDATDGTCDTRSASSQQAGAGKQATCAEAAAAGDMGEAEHKQEVLLELPAHTALLAGASGYWKARLLRWRKRRATNASPDTAMVMTLPATSAVAPVTETATVACCKKEKHAQSETSEKGMQAGQETAVDEAPQEKKQKYDHQGLGLGIAAASTSTDNRMAPPVAPGGRTLQKECIQSEAVLETVGTGPADYSIARSAPPGVMVEHIDCPGDMEAVCSVLQFLYTQKLPEEATLTLLLQMAVQADKWDMPHIVQVCIKQAAKAENMTTTAEVDSLLSGYLPPTIKVHTDFKGVVDSCARALLKLFGRAQTVVTNQLLLDAFCSISLESLQLWAQQDKLMVDSENTVAVLFTHWWHKNRSSMNEQQAMAASKSLTSLIRAGQLSQTFVLCTLETLPWFKHEEGVVAALRTLQGTKLCEMRDAVRSMFPPGWAMSSRMPDEQQGAVLNWIVTKAQLDQLHKDAEAGEAMLLSDDSLYWCGYRWHLGLLLSDQKSAMWFGLTKWRSAMPSAAQDAACMAGVPSLLPQSKFDLAVHGAEKSFTKEVECPRAFAAKWSQVLAFTHSLVCQRQRNRAQTATRQTAIGRMASYTCRLR